MVSRIVDGLAVLRCLRLVHNDLKDRNVLVDDFDVPLAEMTPELLDVGLRFMCAVVESSGGVVGEMISPQGC